MNNSSMILLQSRSRSCFPDIGFFGLVNELLGERFGEEVFLDRTKPDESILSTAKLIQLLESSGKYRLESVSKEKYQYFQNLYECLFPADAG